MQTSSVDYSRKWLVMSAVAMALFLETIDISIVNVALPTLVRAFHTDFATIQWVILAFLLTQTTLMMSIGRLGDMVGKKAIMTWGFVVFSLTSMLCGFAPSIGWLIGLRVVQGVAAAMAFALSMGIATEAFPPTERGKALGTIGLLVSVGIVSGPVVGGYLIDALSWEWIFFVNVPIGVLGVFLTQRYVPDIRPVGKQSFDYAGGLIFLVFLLTLLLALTFGQKLGFGNLWIVSLLAISAIFLAGFIWVEWRVNQPVIDLRLFLNSYFSLNLSMRLISFVAFTGVSLMLPFYLEDMQGYSPAQVGWLLAVVSICFGITAPIAGILSDRFGSRVITIVGIIIFLAGSLIVATLNLETSMSGYIIRMVLFGIGMGVFQSPNNSILMGAVPRTQLGVASSLLSVTRTLGRGFGLALIGAAWTGRVMNYVGEWLPGGVTAAPLPAQIAGMQDTLLIISGLIFLALVLGVWGVIRERTLQAVEIVKI